MSIQPRHHPGGAPVSRLAELPLLERQVIRCLRLWCEGPLGHQSMRRELCVRHRPAVAERLASDFGALLATTAAHARRPLLGHALDCPCAGSDECVFARFVSLAAEGAREEAVLIASLLVRADLALGLAALAEEIGLGLARGNESGLWH